MTLARARRLLPAQMIAMAILIATAARAQSIEPRAYAPAPVSVNFLVGALAATRGGIADDTALPVTDAHIETFGPTFGYARSFGLFGQSAKMDFQLPYGRLTGSAVYQGQTIERRATGFGDPRLRVSAILLGAPALQAPEFRSYHQDFLVGASLQVTAPLGQHDGERLLNIGAHRWAIKPEIGVSKAAGRFVFELSGAVTLFGADDDFYGGHRRTQGALWAGQAHLIYSGRSGLWGSLDATYFTGARAAIDGVDQGGLERNLRLGATLAVPVSRRHSIKLFASRGVSARTRSGYDLAGAAWQYRWGGGL